MTCKSAQKLTILSHASGTNMHGEREHRRAGRMLMPYMRHAGARIGREAIGVHEKLALDMHEHSQAEQRQGHSHR